MKKENLSLHILSEKFLITFFTQKNLYLSVKIYDDLFSHHPQIMLFIHPTFTTYLLFLRNLSLQNSLSPLHIFVPHCTLCASLHVKTSHALVLCVWLTNGALEVCCMLVAFLLIY